jgi:hypothetical protein
LLGVDANGPNLNTSFYFDSQLFLFEGCGLTCIVSNDDSPQFSSLSYTSALLIDESVQGMEYIVFVSGFGTSRGLFEVSLKSVEPLLPPNPTCDTAITLEPMDSEEGSTIFALGQAPIPETVDYICGATGSYFNNYTSASAAYYKVAGTGGMIEAKFQADFQAQLSIFVGGDCPSPFFEESTCLDSIMGNFEQRGVAWATELGQTYTIEVRGAYSFDAGTFELSIQEVEAPANDDCESAESIEVGESVVGSTRYASPVDLSDCGVDVYYPEAAVWYELVPESYALPEGDGVVSGYSISIGNHTGGHRVSVFIGDDCGALTCIANATGGASFTSNWTTDFLVPGDENTAGYAAIPAYLEWEAEPGASYYVVVSQRWDDFGWSPLWGDVDFTFETGAWAIAK